MAWVCALELRLRRGLGCGLGCDLGYSLGVVWGVLWGVVGEWLNICLIKDYMSMYKILSIVKIFI